MGSDAADGTAVSTSIVVLGVFLIVFGLSSRRIKEYYLTETLLSTLFGILLGAKVFGILDFISSNWDQARETDTGIFVLQWVLRIVISVQIFFAACTLPSRYLLRRDSALSVGMLVGPVMGVGWVISSCLVRACIPSLPWTECFLIGAAVSPTDPVLASSVVKGHFAEQHVPKHLRDLLICDSGINDGLALPFIQIPLLLILNNHRIGPTIWQWFSRIVIYEVFGGAILGTFLGVIVRKALKQARIKKSVDRESLLVLSLSVAMVCTGIADLIGVSEFLTAFFAGTSLNWTDSIRHDDLKTHFSEGIEMISDSTIFILIGTILPFDAWNNADYITVPRLILLGLAIMAVRRIPIVLAVAKLVPDLKTWREALFVGHFGPLGTGSLYFALSVAQELPTDSTTHTVIIPVVMFIIFVSIIVHGCSAPLMLLASQIPHRYVRQIMGEKGADGEEEQAEEGQAGPEAEEAGESTSLLGGTALVPGRVARELADKSQGAISRSRLDTILQRGRSRKKRHSRRSDDAEAGRGADGSGGGETPTSNGDEEDGEGSDDDPRPAYAAAESSSERNKRQAASKHRGAPRRRRSPSPAPSEDSLHDLQIYDESSHVVIEYPDGRCIARKVKKDG